MVYLYERELILDLYRVMAYYIVHKNIPLNFSNIFSTLYPPKHLGLPTIMH
jgi:hypothetical protein